MKDLVMVKDPGLMAGFASQIPDDPELAKSAILSLMNLLAIIVIEGRPISAQEIYDFLCEHAGGGCANLYADVTERVVGDSKKVSAELAANPNPRLQA